MSSYLVVKNTNSDSCSYLCKDTHTSVPYLKVDTGYLDLTTETTTGTYLVVKNSDSTYRPKKVITSTQDTSYIIDNGYSCASRYSNYSYISVTSSINTTITSNAVVTSNRNKTDLSISNIIYRTGYNTISNVTLSVNSLYSSGYFELFSSATGRNMFGNWYSATFYWDNTGKPTNGAVMYTDSLVGVEKNYLYIDRVIRDGFTGMQTKQSLQDVPTIYTGNGVSIKPKMYPLGDAEITLNAFGANTNRASQWNSLNASCYFVSAFNGNPVSSAIYSYMGDLIETTTTISTYSNDISYAFSNSARKTSYWTSSNTQGAQSTTALTLSSTRESTYSTEA